MDLKTRLQQLEEARTAGYLNDAEFQELRRGLLNALKSADFERDGFSASAQAGPAQATTPTDAGREAEAISEDEGIHPLRYMEMLVPGLEIGPANHRFRLERPLGEGEEGRVWLATELSLQVQGDRRKALKLFAPRLQEHLGLAAPAQDEHGKTADRTELQNLRPLLVRIRARATLAALIDHPHIARVYGWRYGKDGWPFVEMEYLSGQSLRQRLDREGRATLDWAHTLPLLRPIAAALDHAHQHYHLPHRSLKAENVFITGQGVVKILDFSLVYQPRPALGRLQNPGTDFRVVRSLLPESRAMQQQRFKPDVCALAALTYEILTGKAPCGKQRAPWHELYTVPSFARLPVLTEELVQPPALTDSAWQILLPCLHYQLDVCPDSAGELVRRLEAAQGPVSVESRGNLKTWVAVLVAVSIVAGGFYLWFAGRSAPPQETARVLPDSAGRPPGVETARQPAAAAVSPESPAQEGGAGSSTQPGDSGHAADERAFAAAVRLDTLNAYRTYLQQCPDCAHREDAETAVNRLQLQTQVGALKDRFAAHLQARELTSGSQRDKHALAVLKELEAINPQDPFIAEGKRQIALAYGELARESLNQHNYGEARNRLGKGEAVMAGLKELAELAGETDTAEARDRDDAAYEQARRTNQRAAYQAYLANCEPVCGHRREAQAALEQAAPEPSSAAHRVFRDPLADGGQGPDMVVIPAGTFSMGSPPTEKDRLNDESLHQVPIDKAFAIGQYEVTFEEYDRFAEATGRQKPADKGWGRSRRPVINVSWQDALAYTEWLSAQTGQRYRLPTEAEWEYAARAGTLNSRYWGDNPDKGCDYANAADLKGQSVFTGWTVMNCNDGYVYTAPVGMYKPNAFGLYDMLGNVWEWTCSVYEDPYQGAEQVCAAKETVAPRVARGGSWSDQPGSVRAADRYKVPPEFRDYFLGLRVVREL